MKSIRISIYLAIILAFIRNMLRRIQKIREPEKPAYLYILTVDEPTKATGRIYSRQIMEREIRRVRHGIPFTAHLGGGTTVMRKGSFEGLPHDMDTLIGTVDDFRFRGNALVGRLSFANTAAALRAEDLIKSVGKEHVYLSVMGAGNCINNIVQNDYHLVAFDLKTR